MDRKVDYSKVILDKLMRNKLIGTAVAVGVIVIAVSQFSGSLVKLVDTAKNVKVKEITIRSVKVSPGIVDVVIGNTGELDEYVSGAKLIIKKVTNVEYYPDGVGGPLTTPVIYNAVIKSTNQKDLEFNLNQKIDGNSIDRFFLTFYAGDPKPYELIPGRSVIELGAATDEKGRIIKSIEANARLVIFYGKDGQAVAEDIILNIPSAIDEYSIGQSDISKIGDILELLNSDDPFVVDSALSLLFELKDNAAIENLCEFIKRDFANYKRRYYEEVYTAYPEEGRAYLVPTPDRKVAEIVKIGREIITNTSGQCTEK